MDGSVFSMTGPWDSDRDRVQRDFGFRFDFEARGRANFEAGVQAPGRLEGQPVWSGIFTAGYIGNLCRVTRSLHGYGLATVSGERAWFCPRFAPLPEWLLPPPARGHPVSSRGRIERHGAYKQPRIVGAAGNCAGSQYAARRANLGCINSFGAVALTAWLGDRQCQRQWRWRFSGLDKVPSGNLDKLTLLGTITPWSSG